MLRLKSLLFGSFGTADKGEATVAGETHLPLHPVIAQQTSCINSKEKVDQYCRRIEKFDSYYSSH